MLVQTRVELAEDADPRTPMRNCQPGEVADMLFKGQGHWDSFCPQKRNLQSLFFTMNFLSLFPNTMPPQKWLRPFKTSPRKWCCLCLFFLMGRHGVISKWLITNTLKVKIHKWYVKSSTQFYLSTKKNPLEIKTEIRVIVTRFLFFRFFSECFTPTRHNLCKCDVMPFVH